MKSIKAIMFFTVLSIANFSFAHNLPIKYSKNTNDEQIKIFENTFNEIGSILPAKFIEGLPKDIVVSVEKITNHSSVPTDICDSKAELKDNKSRFVYGEYSPITNSLKINQAVFNEFKKGKGNSIQITCQHKSIYAQSIATIVHELAHAFDQNQDRISSTIEFLRRAGFRKGLLKIKNKNTSAIRTADAYELESVKESFAVNFEYFILDEEYACRRPSMFDFYKNMVGADPYPNRNCILNKNVMMSTSQGFIPFNIDPKRIYRIDYLMASPGSDLSSGFGHSMFRLVVCAPERFDVITGKTISATPYGKKCLEDKLYHVVVSYRANVEDATLNYLKGIMGGYPSMLFILNFGDVLDEYNRDEMRDVFAYPLNLSESEKTEVVKKVIEEHWNYRGSYKFFTNNCAVESLDLLKASLNRSQIYKNSPITPNGLLDDLDKIELLDRKSTEVETYKAKTDQLIESYKVTYDPKTKKLDKKVVMKFIDESKASDRMNVFEKFQKEKLVSADAHGELFDLKRRLVKASSFSVIEQQVLRTLGAKFRKKAADLYMNTKDQELKNKLEKASQTMKTSFSEMSKDGYGVPLANEMVTIDQINEKIEGSKDSLKEIEEIFQSLMPEEFATLNSISSNIIKMNEQSIQIRKEYRIRLEKYVGDVLNNMRSSDDSLQILLRINHGDKQAIKELRNLLDPNLISDKEILDSKLQKMIAEMFN